LIILLWLGGQDISKPMPEIEPYKPGLVRNRGLIEQLKEFQRNPRSLVFVSLAESYRAEGLPHQALDILEEGLAVHPGLASGILARARCLFDLRRYAEALGVVQEALLTNPQNLKARKIQAEIYVRLGQRKAAIRALTEVVSLYPQDVEAVRALEELENLAGGRLVPAEKVGRASVDSAPPSGRIEDFQVGPLGDSLAAIGALGGGSDWEDTVDTGSLSVAPESPGGDAVTGESPLEEAEPTFATRTIAELYLRQGLKGKAIKVLRKILRDDSANSWARETLQELESDGIVLPAKPQVRKRPTSLERRAKALEVLLARVRLMRRAGA
jgi:tetratricopeptide (TPR) repeat protein